MSAGPHKRLTAPRQPRTRREAQEIPPPPPNDDATPPASGSPAVDGEGAGVVQALAAFSPMYDLDRSIDELNLALGLIATVSHRLGTDSQDCLAKAFLSIHGKLNTLYAMRAGLVKP